MPELPEVETIVRDLRSHLLERKIQDVQLVGHPMFKEDPSLFRSTLTSRVIKKIHRHGKSIFFEFDSTPSQKSFTLRVHLGMTGQLLFKKSNEPIEPHTHLIFKLDEGRETLRYLDIRRFGKMEIAPRGAELHSVPDAWDAPKDKILTALKKISGHLKHALLSQKIIAGLGNIYVDESLHQARLHPLRRGSALKGSDWTRLAASIHSVLSRAINVRGTSFQNYVDLSGRKGGFLKMLSVYGKKNEPCSCGARIRRIVVAGRGTYFCPQCQHQPK